jgi:hypothetical protein
MAKVPRTITGPIKVERHDLESGDIAYEIVDWGSKTYHRICTVENNKEEAEFVALALNNAIGASHAPELDRIIKASVERFKAMTQEEQEAEIRKQRESWARQDMD